MRKHGWQLPYHPLQIVAVAVFSALIFSFYVFFIPFLGSGVLKFHVIAIFSPLVFAVFLLYVRCAAINPADSGLLRAKVRVAAAQKLESSAEILLRHTERLENGLEQSDDEHRSPQNVITVHKNSQEIPGKLYKYLCCTVVVLWSWIPGAGLLLSLFLDDKKEVEKFIPEEDLLYCSLCEAEILKTSKHCRACDKCVDGFDHHCRWLNNCIGKKNYKTFVAVMVSCLLLLILQWSIGIYVLVRCFSSKHQFDEEIVKKLGSSFSRLPYIVVVTICTFLAMMATLPLLQLLFFHLILIKKGISTYDYIVAIREVEQHAGREPHIVHSRSSSPASSVATAVSGASSLGALRSEVWCTPPRMFVEHQTKEKAGLLVQYSPSGQGAPGRLPVEAEADASISQTKKESFGGHHKRPIGLSPWKLARLSTKEVSKASARARANSTIMHPIKCHDRPIMTETEESSFESGAEILTASGCRKGGCKLYASPPTSGNFHHPALGASHYNVTNPMGSSNGRVSPVADQGRGISPLQSEARSPFRAKSSLSLTAFSSAAGSTINSPDVSDSPDVGAGGFELYHNASQGRSWLHRSTSDGYEASGGESADEISDHGRQLSKAWSKIMLNPSFINRAEWQTTNTNWGSQLDSQLEAIAHSQSSVGSKTDCLASSSARDTWSTGSRAEANILKHVKEWPGMLDRISTSTEGSYNSSPSHYESPTSHQITPDSQSGGITQLRHVDNSSLQESARDQSFVGGSPKSTSGKKSVSSARRLKNSILAYKRGLSTSSTEATLLSSSP